jgi:DnaK suppressor protein
MEELSKTEVEAFRSRLTARLEELRELTDISKDDRAAVELDQTRVGRLSRMDALQVQAMAKAQGERRTAEISRTESALKRIESGDYGYCVSCDEPIARKRLEADPSNPVCVDCAGKG